MNEMIPVILSSTLITTVLTFFFNAVVNRRTAAIENITKERKIWRDEMRGIAKEIQSSKDSRQLCVALSSLKVRINAYGIAQDSFFKDAHIWQQIHFFEEKDTHTPEELENAKRVFVDLISCLLKFDWERSKAEIRGNLPTRILVITLVASFLIYSVQWFYYHSIGAGRVSNYFTYVIWYGVYVIFAMLMIFVADKWKNKLAFSLYLTVGTVGVIVLYSMLYFGIPSAAPHEMTDYIVRLAPIAALIYCVEVKLLSYRKNIANYILSLAWVCGLEEIDQRYRVFFDQDEFHDLFTDKVVKFVPKQKKRRKIFAR